MPEYQEKLLSLLRQVCEIFGKSPDLSSMQLLGSIDGLSCVVIGNWLNEYALENIQAQDPFSYAGKVSSLLYWIFHSYALVNTCWRHHLWSRSCSYHECRLLKNHGWYRPNRSARYYEWCYWSYVWHAENVLRLWRHARWRLHWGFLGAQLCTRVPDLYLCT